MYRIEEAIFAPPLLLMTYNNKIAISAQASASASAL